MSATLQRSAKDVPLRVSYQETVAQIHVAPPRGMAMEGDPEDDFNEGGGLCRTVIDSATDWRSTGRSLKWSRGGSSRSMPSLGTKPTSGALMSSTSSPWRPSWHTRTSLASEGPASLTGGRTMWSPLGGTWRRRNFDEDGFVRANVDDASEFVEGCVPAWSRSAKIRKGQTLEHELCWAYYLMRRHVDHPERKRVGERLPLKDVPREMRVSKGAEFQFWRDLRPPFSINSAGRVDEGNQWHPDGELFEVKYECGIDYASERVCPEQGACGTFDTKVRGTASIRIPHKFPVERPIHIISWGRPYVSHTQSEEADKGAKGGHVAEEIWNPMANELQLRPDHQRLDTVREASRKVSAKVHLRPVQVQPLQRLALGPHASLPRLAEAERNIAAKNAAGGDPMPSGKSRLRGHRICTAAAGFVSYVG